MRRWTRAMIGTVAVALALVIGSRADAQEAVRVEVIPGRPYIEQGDAAQYLNFDFLVDNGTREPIKISRIGLLAHLKPGTVSVKRGDRVRQGQIIGAIGVSGEGGTADAFHVHLHYQLSSGPGFENALGLPSRFSLSVAFGERVRSPLPAGESTRATSFSRTADAVTTRQRLSM